MLSGGNDQSHSISWTMAIKMFLNLLEVSSKTLLIRAEGLLHFLTLKIDGKEHFKMFFSLFNYFIILIRKSKVIVFQINTKMIKI